jgi:hypothetical protein
MFVLVKWFSGSSGYSQPFTPVGLASISWLDMGQKLSELRVHLLKLFFDGRQIMNQAVRRNRLLPWYIGIAIVILGELYIGYEMFYVGCPAPVMLELAVLIVIPIVYLTLMYLTFVSQD